MSQDRSKSSTEPVVKWVGDDVSDFRPEVFQVQSSQEATALLCGTQHADGSDDGAQHAVLERRIVFSPAMAKKLAIALAEAAAHHERIAFEADGTPSGQLRTMATEEDVPEAAVHLFRLVDDLGVDFGLERSFKMTKGDVFPERVILGIRRELVDEASLTHVCRKIGMPEDQLKRFIDALPNANTVGFGFDTDGAHNVFKVYLEYWKQLTEHVRNQPGKPEPQLLFLGFKWLQDDPDRAALANYICYPRLPVEGIRERIKALYEDRQNSPSLSAALAILQLACFRSGSSYFVYVEATEEGNPRRSFDLNLYKANLKVADLLPVLRPLAHNYAISEEAFSSAIEQASAQPFGHLSGGLGRAGEDFLTCYYEIEGL